MSSVHNSGSLTRIVVITGKTRPPGKIILGEVCVRATLTKGKLIEQHEKYRRKQLFVVISHNSRLLVKKLTIKLKSVTSLRKSHRSDFEVFSTINEEHWYVLQLFYAHRF